MVVGLTALYEPALSQENIYVYSRVFRNLRTLVMACPPVALECTDITKYPIAGCLGFHLHDIDTERFHLK